MKPVAPFVLFALLFVAKLWCVSSVRGEELPPVRVERHVDAFQTIHLMGDRPLITLDSRLEPVAPTNDFSAAWGKLWHGLCEVATLSLAWVASNGRLALLAVLVVCWIGNLLGKVFA